MKKIRLFILFATALTFNMAFAVNLSDIDTIRTVSVALYQDATNLMQFAQQLQQSNLNGFIFTVNGTTQTVALSAAQKQGLIAQYQNLKAQMVADFQNLP